jgi:hypothetical protein
MVVEWIDLAQDRDRRWAVGNTGIKFWFPVSAGNFFANCEPVRFSEGLISMEIEVGGVI